MTKTIAKPVEFRVGQFVRLGGNHERAGECGTIEKTDGKTATFRFHFDGVETVQSVKALSANTILYFGL